jgi:hypothetical protein
MHTFIVNATLFTLCHSDIFSPQRAIFKEYTSTASQKNELQDVKYSVVSSVIITYQLSEQHYTLLTQLNFTSGNPFR